MSSIVNLALPNQEDAPAKCAEFFVISFIAIPVTCKLWKPIPGLGFRNMCLGTTPMLVPKASTNLDYFLAGTEN